MTLKQNEITAIRSGSHLLPDSRAVVTCDLGSMITTITRTAWLSRGTSVPFWLSTELRHGFIERAGLCARHERLNFRWLQKRCERWLRPPVLPHRERAVLP